MKIVIISYPDYIAGEESLVRNLIDNGLEYYHVRKPNWSKSELAGFLSQIPPVYLKKIIIHNHWDLMDEFNIGGVHIREADKHNLKNQVYSFHSMAIHSLDELSMEYPNLNYVLLSPVFDSISKQYLKAGFKMDLLQKSLQGITPRLNVFALGGVSNQNISLVKNMGFSGAAVLGYIWDIFKVKGQDNTIEAFNNLKKLCH